jgi:hypothetical protein
VPLDKYEGRVAQPFGVGLLDPFSNDFPQEISHVLHFSLAMYVTHMLILLAVQVEPFEPRTKRELNPPAGTSKSVWRAASAHGLTACGLRT